MFAGNFAIRGWAFCDGQLLPIAQYSALFSLLGTIYGGDGRTTFGLPDLRGRAPIHEGQGPGLPNVRLGQKGGNPTTVLGVQNLPSHNHGSTNLIVGASSKPAGTDSPANAVFAVSGEDAFIEEAANTRMAQSSVSGNTDNTGGGIGFSNMQPYLGINYLIALQGVFPSRS